MSFIFVEKENMEKLKHKLRSGAGMYKRTAMELRFMADESLDKGPYSVTYTKSPAASGNIHDYYSIGPYWWPNEADPGGPYIQKDGLRYPGGFQKHDQDLDALCEAVVFLSAAAYFFDERKYSDWAAKLIKVWFIDEETLMNPHLEYSQAIQGLCSGRSIGVMDSRVMTKVVHALGFLEEIGLYSDVVDGAKEWFKRFLVWLTTSKFGIDERNNGNNHASFCVVQTLAYAVFTGNKAVENECYEFYKKAMIPDQMVGRDEKSKHPAGSFPQELRRTNSLEYSLFNLTAFAAICELAHLNGVDLWHFETKDGKGIKNAIEYLTPYYDNPYLWQYPQINGMPPEENYAFMLAPERLGMTGCEKLNAKRRQGWCLVRENNNSYLGPLVLLR